MIYSGECSICLAVTWSEQGQTSTRLEREPVPSGSQETWQLLFPPCLGGSQHMCTSHQQSPALPQPFCYCQRSSNQPRRFVSLVQDPGLWPSNCGSQLSLPGVGICLYILPAGGTGLNLTAFLPFLPDYMCIFLISLVVQESFCQIPVSFQ